MMIVMLRKSPSHLRPAKMTAISRKPVTLALPVLQRVVTFPPTLVHKHTPLLLLAPTPMILTLHHPDMV